MLLGKDKIFAHDVLHKKKEISGQTHLIELKMIIC